MCFQSLIFVIFFIYSRKTYDLAKHILVFTNIAVLNLFQKVSNPKVKMSELRSESSSNILIKKTKWAGEETNTAENQGTTQLK